MSEFSKPHEMQNSHGQNEGEAWREATTPGEVLNAVIAENTKTNGNVMLELTSQRTGEAFWINPIRVVDEITHPENFNKDVNNNGEKFQEDLQSNQLRITQVVPLVVQLGNLPERMRPVVRQKAINRFVQARGYESDGAYAGHFVKMQQPEQS